MTRLNIGYRNFIYASKGKKVALRNTHWGCFFAKLFFYVAKMGSLFIAEWRQKQLADWQDLMDASHSLASLEDTTEPAHAHHQWLALALNSIDMQADLMAVILDAAFPIARAISYWSTIRSPADYALYGIASTSS